MTYYREGVGKEEKPALIPISDWWIDLLQSCLSPTSLPPSDDISSSGFTDSLGSNFGT